MPGKQRITTKRPLYGNNVPFSIKKTRTRWNINIQRKRFYVPSLKKYVQIQITASEMRTIDKLGIEAYMHKRGLKIADYVI
jgi:large subunit ribosomal protein L28